MRLTVRMVDSGADSACGGQEADSESDSEADSVAEDALYAQRSVSGWW